MKQETLEEAAEKSSLYNEIYSIVKQIPRKETNSDAMDYPSAISSIEELFHKWQQDQAKEMEKEQQCYNEEEVIEILLTFRAENPRYIEEFLEQFKKK